MDLVVGRRVPAPLPLTAPGRAKHAQGVGTFPDKHRSNASSSLSQSLAARRDLLLRWRTLGEIPSLLAIYLTSHKIALEDAHVQMEGASNLGLTKIIHSPIQRTMSSHSVPPPQPKHELAVEESKLAAESKSTGVVRDGYQGTSSDEDSIDLHKEIYDTSAIDPVLARK